MRVMRSQDFIDKNKTRIDTAIQRIEQEDPTAAKRIRGLLGADIEASLNSIPDKATRDKLQSLLLARFSGDDIRELQGFIGV